MQRNMLNNNMLNDNSRSGLHAAPV